ncbi:MAG TPA: DUF4386 domain-containing protein [Pseudonocardiaceae bacterium]|nr:DUF4386 domain-containing protein [Pseudonocardiaceae bacterium]
MTVTTTQRTRGPDGPPAGVLATVSLALTVAGLAVSAALGGGTLPVSPLESTGTVAGYYLAHPGAATAAGLFAFGAGVPLGIFAATVYARLLRLGVRVPGPGIAYYGGISASVLVGVAGLLSWVIGQPITGQSPAVIHTLAYATYALGGVGYVGGVGLLIAGVAVPSLILGFTPRWFAWLGLLIAALSELGILSLVVPAFDFTLPVGRFIGLLWLIAVGFLLPRNRHDIATRTDQQGQ